MYVFNGILLSVKLFKKKRLKTLKQISLPNRRGKKGSRFGFTNIVTEGNGKKDFGMDFGKERT